MIDLSYAGYLLFVVPGFCSVWTYRHFTESGKMGEFEYAVWSFLWGVPQFLFFGFIASWEKTASLSIPLNNPGAILGSLVGISLVLVLGESFISGFIAARLSRGGLFIWIDKKLFWLLDKPMDINSKPHQDKTAQTSRIADKNVEIKS